MPSLKKITLIFYFLVPLFVYGQENADTIRIAELENKKYYSEVRTFKIDSALTLHQEYGNNRLNISHESYYVFRITISDIGLLKEGKTFDVLKDSSSIKCYYRFKSFANKERDKSKFTGTIKVLSVSDNRIEIQQNVIVNSERKWHNAIVKSVLFFDGPITFIKENN